MLDLAVVDIATLAEALEDRSTEWWFDPRNGQLEPWTQAIGDEIEEGHPLDRGLRLVEPIGSSEAYGDMEDFIPTVSDARARDLLARAITGTGAFRRFKDTLYEFPELREAWFALKDARMRERALYWLADERLVQAEVIEQAIAGVSDPSAPPVAPTIPVASAAAAGLRALYGERLRRVILYGSAARGDADRESDVDLLVVLDDMRSSWDERAHMDALLWRVSYEHGTVVSALPVRASDVQDPRRPLLIRALADGVDIA